jgi:predicted membrane chloride channel (bestrophin family)
VQLLNWLVDLDEILYGGDGIELFTLSLCRESRHISSSQNFLFMIIAFCFFTILLLNERVEKGMGTIPQSEEPLILSLSTPGVSIFTWMGRGFAFSRTRKCLNSQNSLVIEKLCSNRWLEMTSYTTQLPLCMSY